MSVIIKHFHKCTVSRPPTPSPPSPLPPPPLSTVMDHWSFLLLASSALFKSIRPADCQKWQVFCSRQCLGHVTLCFFFFKKKRNRIIIPNMIVLKTEVLPHFNLHPHFQTKGKYGATLQSTHSHRVNHLTQETWDPVTAGTLIFSLLYWCCGSPSNLVFLPCAKDVSGNHNSFFFMAVRYFWSLPHEAEAVIRSPNDCADI